MDPSDEYQRLARQFAKSLKGWGGWQALISHNPDHLTAEAGSYVKQALADEGPCVSWMKDEREGEWKQIVPLARVFLNAYLVQEYDRLMDGGSGSLTSLLYSVESPIEALMLLSLILCARENHVGVSVDWVWKGPKDDRSFEENLDLSIGTKRLKLEIRPQAQIGDHRVDFLLSFHGTDIVRSEPREGQPDRGWQEIRLDKKMIVECDGHDFHEKTKEQARRDKERDRNLQSLGFPVYRYTGSELYADVFRCAAEIVRVLTGREIPKD